MVVVSYEWFIRETGIIAAIEYMHGELPHTYIQGGGGLLITS